MPVNKSAKSKSNWKVECRYMQHGGVPNIDFNPGWFSINAWGRNKIYYIVTVAFSPGVKDYYVASFPGWEMVWGCKTTTAFKWFEYQIWYKSFSSFFKLFRSIKMHDTKYRLREVHKGNYGTVCLDRLVLIKLISFYSISWSLFSPAF